MKKNKNTLFIILLLVAGLNGIIGPLSILVQEYLVNMMEDITNKLTSVTMISIPIIFLFILYMIPNMKFISDYLNIKWNAELEIRNIFHLQNKIKKLPYILLESNEIYDKITYLKENNRYVIKYSLILQILQVLINTVLYICVLLRYSWFLPIICLALIPFITYYIMRFSKLYYNKVFDLTLDERIASDKMDILTEREYAKELRMFSSGEFVCQDYSNRKTIFNKIYLKNLIKYSTVSKLISISKFVPILLCLFSVLFLYNGNHITLAAFVAVSSHLINMNFLEFYQGLVGNYTKYKLVCKMDNELNELINNKESVSDVSLGENAANIVFDHVFFRYPKTDAYILEDVSFQIQGNKKIALVGENGSGKSTLIKLMLGLYQPEKGSILVNGIDIKNISRESLANIFGCMFQDFAKYGVSLKENIAFDMENNKCEEVMKAYDIDKIAARLTDGYDTVLGKIYADSMDLSGGEWQTVAIARTFAENKKAFIFDEPTAALDPIAEVNIFQKIMEHSSDNMTFLVTHRLGISSLVDTIMVLKEGKLNEIGSFQQLMDQKGSFFYLYNLQRQMYIKKEGS